MGNQATGTELGRGCHMPRATALLDDPRSPLAPKQRQHGGMGRICLLRSHQIAAEEIDREGFDLAEQMQNCRNQERNFLII
uniref:Uncharacterized protein n=1 Tax=Oryza meridionalis TaxID=40149 RepID=A0A0E0E3S0_9ORYZ